MPRSPAILAFLCGALAPCLLQGEPPPARTDRAPGGPVPEEQGTVDAAGKFSPRAEPAPGAAAPTREQAEARLRDALRVTPDGPDRFRIGQVTFDRKLRTVTIPAAVNMNSGVVEYALVTKDGKLHEAVFSTKARPDEIHLACLLLGMPALGEPAAMDEGHAVPAANAVKVSVGWETNGPPADYPLAALVVASDAPTDPGAGRPLPDGPWLYNGSVTAAGGFAATREGSVISLIPDGAALVNNTRAGCRNDEHHLANQALLPPKGNPVRITLTLPPAVPAAPAAQ